MRYRRPISLPANRSFKFKLAGYFVLLSLLPATAAFLGFSAVAKQSELRRVDARLQSGLRAAIEAYSEDLEATAEQAHALANDVRFQAALAEGDAAGVRSLLRYPNLRVETADFAVGPRPDLAAEREVHVVGPEGPLGYVVAFVPFDKDLLRRVTRRSGLTDGEQFVVVESGRVVAGAGWSEARLDVPLDRPTSVTVGDTRYRVLVAATFGERPGATLAVVAAHDAIDAATAEIQGRLLLGLLAALFVIALVAYLEGRSIVRTVASIGRAANAIARGKLDERVPVRGRDELARLGNAFNQMADQLQQRLEELESERHRLREAVARFGDALAATHDTDQLLRAIVETAVEATGAAGGMLIGSEGQVVEVGTPGRGADQIEIPLTAARETFGTLFLFGRTFDEEARLTAFSLVGQSVVALENARLHRIVERQALVDGLTGLPNRRQCEEALRNEVSRARRFGTPLSVVVGDLDDFKAVNDEHGHPVGDTVMCEFARILERLVRGVDLAGRWGGEEFILLLPGTDADGALRLAERIRDFVEGRTLVTPEGVPVRVTVSFGVAEHSPEQEPDDLVWAADSALYQAKQAGKNRVSLFGPARDIRNLS